MKNYRNEFTAVLVSKDPLAREVFFLEFADLGIAVDSFSQGVEKLSGNQIVYMDIDGSGFSQALEDGAHVRAGGLAKSVFLVGTGIESGYEQSFERAASLFRGFLKKPLSRLDFKFTREIAAAVQGMPAPSPNALQKAGPQGRFSGLPGMISGGTRPDPSFVLEEVLRVVASEAARATGARKITFVLPVEMGKKYLMLETRAGGPPSVTMIQARNLAPHHSGTLSGSGPRLVRPEEYRALGLGDGAGSTGMIVSPVGLNDSIQISMELSERQERDFDSSDLDALAFNLEEMRDLFYSLNDLDDVLKRGIGQYRKSAKAQKTRRDLHDKSRELVRIRRSLARKSIELSTIHRVGEIVKTTFVLEELSRMIVELVTGVMGCRRCSILVVNDDEQGDLLIKGAKGLSIQVEHNIRLKTRGAVTRHILETGRHLVVKDIQKELGIDVDRNKGYESGAFIAVPIRVRNEIIGIINVADKQSGQHFNDTDLKLLVTLSSQIGLMLENFRMSKELLDKERIRKELEIAADIQRKLLQRESLADSRMEIRAITRSAREMGGDFYNFQKRAGKIVDISLADVSGKGIPAALVMIMLSSYMRVLLKGNLSPSSLLKRLNDLLLTDIAEEMFVTMFHARYDQTRSTLTYSNGGHFYPLLIRGEKIDELRSRGAILGMFDTVDYDENSIRVEPGDTFVLYTDGITEAMDPEMEEFGRRRLLDVIRKVGKTSCEGLIDAILEAVDEFSMGAERSDDQTLVVINIKE